jgi:hypothetical protein
MGGGQARKPRGTMDESRERPVQPRQREVTSAALPSAKKRQASKDKRIVHSPILSAGILPDSQFNKFPQRSNSDLEQQRSAATTVWEHLGPDSVPTSHVACGGTSPSLAEAPRLRRVLMGPAVGVSISPNQPPANAAKGIALATRRTTNQPSCYPRLQHFHSRLVV